jgi:hypothetical protein
VYTNFPRVQSRYISEVDIKRRGGVVGVHDKHVSAPDGLARVELWRFRSGGCGRYIRHGGFAEGAVLVERKKLRVRDDLNLFGAEFRELATEPSRMLVFSEVRNRRKKRSHTSVPSKMGLFMNAHTAKWVRSSWTVKLPLPISIISISLCAKKLTEDKRPAFSLMIDFMNFQVGLMLVPRHRRLDQSRVYRECYYAR